MDRIYVLMGKALSKTITSVEEDELKTLLAQNPEAWYAYELINNLDDDTQEYVQEIRSLLDSPITVKPTTRSYRGLRIAAIVGGVIAVVAGIFRFTTTQPSKPAVEAMSELTAPAGTKTHIVLADGTDIWLNAGSKLRYPSNFTMKNREVYLTGEAYFKVTHDDKHAFVVHAPEVTIRDLGTTFNVKAYNNGHVTEATLIEGAIEVAFEKDPAKKIRMSPGEKIILDNKQTNWVFEVAKIVPYAKTNDIVETAWVEDKLIFRNERFEDLALTMERKYNMTISIEDPAIKAYQVTGIFKNENITEALKLLQVIVPFKYKINNGKVIIYQ